MVEKTYMDGNTSSGLGGVDLKVYLKPPGTPFEFRPSVTRPVPKAKPERTGFALHGGPKLRT